MQIDYRRPTSKGVTQLMYVGDDGLGLDNALTGGSLWWLVGAFAIGWWLGGKRK